MVPPAAAEAHLSCWGQYVRLTATPADGRPRYGTPSSAIGNRRGRESSMKIAIGLPSTLPGVGGGLLRDWARAAEDAGFSSLGTLDRIVYRNLEPLLALTAAASVTQRIGLLTAILIAPTRGADVA